MRTFDQYRQAKLIAASYTCQRAPNREATMKFQSIICIQKQKFTVSRNMCFQGFPSCKTFSCNCRNQSQTEAHQYVSINKQKSQLNFRDMPSTGVQLKHCCAGWGRGRQRHLLRKQGKRNPVLVPSDTDSYKATLLQVEALAEPPPFSV